MTDTLAIDDLASLLDRARQAGADCAEVYSLESTARPVAFEGNRLKQLETTAERGTALRLWRDGRPGIAVTHGPVEATWLVDRALAASELQPPEHPELAPPQTTAFPSVGKEISVEVQIEQGREVIDRIRSAYPEVICSGEWDCDRQTTRLLTSAGLDCRYEETTLSAGVGAEWVRGDDFLAVYDGQQSRDRIDPEALATAICQRLAWAGKNVPAPTGRVPVLLSPKAADLLWDLAEAALSGKRVREGSSPWSDKLGSAIASPLLTLRQEPSWGPSSCPIDDEGTPTRDLLLVENGILRASYSDRATARALGSASTGNGFRPGLGRYPSPELINLVVAPGGGSLLELVQQLGSGLLVDQILGGGADISGDFSINVDLGYRIEGGEIVGRVKDTLVAGNVYTILRDLQGLGADRTWVGSRFTPSVAIAELSVIASD